MTSVYHQLILDLETQDIRFLDINGEIPAHSNAGYLFTSSEEWGNFQFTDELSLYSTLLSSKILSLNMLVTGDTLKPYTSRKTEKISQSRYRTFKYFRPVANFLDESGGVISFRDEEIIEVTTDSLGENTYRDRFFYERSLVKLDDSGQEEILHKFGEQVAGLGIEEINVFYGLSQMVFQAGWHTFSLDLETGESHMFEDYRNPVLSPDGDFMLAWSSGLSLVELESGDIWARIRGYGDENTATFSPNGKYVYKALYSDDEAYIWRSPLPESSLDYSEELNKEMVVDMYKELPTDDMNHKSIGVSQPAFINENEIMFLVKYDGRKWCD